MNKKLIEKITKLVNAELRWNMYKDECGENPDSISDSFGKINIRSYCEPEDAIWYRDLQDNYYAGLEIGIRNTLKIIKDNPKLIK